MPPGLKHAWQAVRPMHPSSPQVFIVLPWDPRISAFVPASSAARSDFDKLLRWKFWAGARWNETALQALVQVAFFLTRQTLSCYATGAGVFLHVLAIILLGIFLGGVIVGIVATAILFSLRRDRRSPPCRVPRKKDDQTRRLLFSRKWHEPRACHSLVTGPARPR